MSWMHHADAEQEKHTGGMVALYPRSDFAQMLAGPGGEPVDDLHVTLVFLGEDVGYQDPRPLVVATARVAESYGEITGRVFGHAVFNPDGHEGRSPCAVYLVGHSPELSQIHTDVVRAAEDVFPIPDQHEPWLPHVTAGYSDQASVHPSRGGSPLSIGEFTGEVIFDRLGLAFAGDTQFFPFHGAALVGARLGYPLFRPL